MQGRHTPILAFALLAVGLGAAALLLHRFMRDGARERAAGELDALASLKVTVVTSWREAQVADARYAATYPSVAAAAARATRGPLDPALASHVHEILQHLAEREGYLRIALLGPDGRSLAGWTRPGEPERPWRADLVGSAAGSPSGSSAELVARPGRNAPALEVAVAIRPPDGTPCALALLADFESVYERVIQRWPVPSRTGTTGMVHRAGEEAVVLASPGGLENGGRSARVPLSARAVPAVQAALGATGVIQGVDLAHHPVMAAIRPIPGTDWRLVAKMDLAEIEAPILGPFAVIASLVAALLGAGAIVLVLWWRADVTRERMEEELRRSQSQLERAERLAEIGSLAAGVAHEINNPLAYVLANLDFLRSRLATPGADADLSEALEEARSGAERVRDVVRGLSAFSRPGTSARGPVDVSAQLQAALRLAANEIRHRARLETAIGPLPSVSATENELGQVFLNLLVNAAQAIPEGHAKENVIRVEASTDARGWARVEVRDTGAGMAPEVQRRIFEPFFTTKGGSGTGLGLAIAHGIVTAAGGRIEVESQNGSGSTFRVFLPPAGPASAPA